ncbi:hypothetical protein U0070_026436, partial [Myodes glareolus]
MVKSSSQFPLLGKMKLIHPTRDEKIFFYALWHLDEASHFGLVNQSGVFMTFMVCLVADLLDTWLSLCSAATCSQAFMAFPATHEHFVGLRDNGASSDFTSSHSKTSPYSALATNPKCKVLRRHGFQQKPPFLSESTEFLQLHTTMTLLHQETGLSHSWRTHALEERAAFNSGKVDIVATNDPFISPNYTAENRKRHQWEDQLHLLGLRSHQHQWGDSSGKYVVESTGCFKTGVQLKGRAKRVIISVPSADTPRVVMSVKHKKYDNSLSVMLSCTTNTQHPQPSIISAPTVADQAVDNATSELKSKLSEWPVPTTNDIKKVVKQALVGPIKDILGHSEDQVISCYFNLDFHSPSFDCEVGISLNDNLVKFMS